MKSSIFKHNEVLYLTRLRQAEELPPSQRLGKRAAPSVVDKLTAEDSPWFETEAEVIAGLEEGRDKAKLLEQIGVAMLEDLNASEIEALQLRYFQGLSYREIAKIMNRNVSTIHRKIERAILKLQDNLEV